ncbi:hypothetical protein [Litoreibacter ponti]|uniref:hypothetical protein n=1 Tax=Litoreibacter ponti TaxID=1510457 RepID=UPI001304AC1D|nr:hypothetical protein [Litoreibacter ponti]
MVDSVDAFFDAAAKNLKDGKNYKYCTPKGRPSVPALLEIFKGDFKGKLSTWRNASPRTGTPKNQLRRTDDLIAIFSGDPNRLFHHSKPLVRPEKQDDYNEVSAFWRKNFQERMSELIIHLQSYRNEVVSCLFELEALSSKEKVQKPFAAPSLREPRIGAKREVKAQSETHSHFAAEANTHSDRSSTSQILNSRLELMNAITAEVSGDLSSYRATTVGPNFLHPDWVVERRNRRSTTPNYEAIYYKAVVSHAGERLHEHRIFFRNTNRYIDKVNRLVEPTERTKFIDDMLERIRLVWGESYDRGPSIRCHNVGFFRVEIVFPNCLIVGRRLEENGPVSGGLLISDPAQIGPERSHFDQIFEAGYRGQETEVQALASFVRNLWTSSE